MIGINFKRLLVKNGLQWIDLDVYLDKVGLALIQGANATGKTSMAELILNILFGKTIKSGQGKSIVNDKAFSKGETYTGTLWFDIVPDSGKVQEYKVVQTYTKGPSVKIYKDGGDNIAPRKASDAHKMLSNDILCMSYNEFITSTILPPKIVHPLITATPGQRISYITDVYALGCYDDLLKASKDRLKEVDSSLEDVRSNRFLLKNIEEDLKEIGDISKQRKKHKSLKSERSVLLEEIDNRDDNHRNLHSKMKSMARRDELKEKFEKLSGVESLTNENISDLRKKAAKLRKDVALSGPKVVHAERREVILDKIKIITSERGKKPKAPPKKALDNATRKAVALSTDILFYQKIDDHDTCPLCTQDLFPVKGKKSPLKRLGKSLDKCKDLIETLTDQQDAVDDYKTVSKTLDTLQAELDSLPSDSVKKAKKAAKKITADLNEMHRRIEEAVKIETIAEELDGLPKGKTSTIKKKIATIKREQASDKKRLSAIDSKLGGLSGTVERVEKLKRTEATALKVIAGSASHVKEAERLSALVRAFGPNGLRRERMRSILSAINENLQHYAHTLLPEYTFRIVDTTKSIIFEAYHRSKPDLPVNIKRMSNGEHSRLSIALLLAERYLRQAKPNLLFLDEFDVALDTEGLDSFMGILVDIAHGEFDSVFAISHLSSAVGSNDFDRRLTTKRKKGASYLKTRVL